MLCVWRQRRGWWACSVLLLWLSGCGRGWWDPGSLIRATNTDPGSGLHVLWPRPWGRAGGGGRMVARERER
eukprot:864263-Prymnesium_polylepis.1